jgi:hypothetical protein
MAKRLCSLSSDARRTFCVSDTYTDPQKVTDGFTGRKIASSGEPEED